VIQYLHPYTGQSLFANQRVDCPGGTFRRHAQGVTQAHPSVVQRVTRVQADRALWGHPVYHGLLFLTGSRCRPYIVPIRIYHTVRHVTDWSRRTNLFQLKALAVWAFSSERIRIVINGVSLLETELGNGQPHHVLVINFQAPSGQEIQRYHGPRDAGTEVQPTRDGPRSCSGRRW
jgi:hypothetical protein